jgi:hypothetical protein
MDTKSSAMDRKQTDRQTVTLNYDTLAVWETKPRTTPQKVSVC